VVDSGSAELEVDVVEPSMAELDIVEEVVPWSVTTVVLGVVPS